ncbi:transcriptional corepressor SEUSS-like [Actinidia eriantha]|uniref:transcriptional corepressor SEUSS-like n=1 Tax=Actinidia eriantha TaxID=165200 RepID=UPI002582D666|nr:transcriptional corepressor SEUSS-like [Actinidia eriantha]XP_057505375.1 transcriptional corepressor SEUSS-like [Actinidia eriantha]XP_057505376.1 transcriptional corepressor SEUSS-like [Actinidia eriantha]
MVPTGPPAPIGGTQPIPPSLLRSNSGLLGQGAAMPSQSAFPSLVAPRPQYNNVNMMGNASNVSSLHQSFGTVGPNSGLSGPGSGQRGVIDNGAESDPISTVGNGMSFTSSPSCVPSNMANPGSSGQVQGQQFQNNSGNQRLPNQQQPQQHDSQNFQHNQQQLHQFSTAQNNQQQQQQQQYQSIRGGLSGVGPVKLEPQMTNDQHAQPSQQLHSLRNLGPVKLERQQIQTLRSLAPVKMEHQHSDPSLFLQQQQQQQQFLHMTRQSPQAAAAAQINLLHQQRLMQLQQQQQLALKALPLQRSPSQQLFQPQNLPLRSPVKPVYEPGMCARRLTHYMYEQQHRPEDNNIEFWRKFVTEFFAPIAKKKWCVSMYGSGRQTTGVFPQDVWHCEICNRKPGRGFEATVEVLPRLFKIKYESGTLEELLYVDMPREYQNSSGQIILDYAKAIQESVFNQLRIVRDGQLRIVFSPDMKICSWEFCARRHEELIPRRLLIPQVSQLGLAAQKYQAATQNASSNLSVSELQNNCNMFVASARQLAKALEMPLVNDLGYTKRYVRCLQISEVVNSMKDLIDYSRETGIGPMESLAKFPRRTNSTSGFHGQPQQMEEQLQQRQQTMGQDANNDRSSVQEMAMQVTSTNGMPSVNNSLSSATVPSSTSAIVGLLHQNSMNSRQQNPMSNANGPYGGSSIQNRSPGSSSTIPQTQPNPSPFQSPTPSSSNNAPQAAHMNSANSPNISMQQPALSGDPDPNDSESSVQKIIQEMMMNSPLNGGGSMAGVGTLGNDAKNVNGILPMSNSMGLNGSNCLVGNGGLGQSPMTNGIRAAMENNSMTMNGRIGMASMARDQTMNHQQQVLGDHLRSGLGPVHGFNNLQFDWKSSP